MEDEGFEIIDPLKSKDAKGHFSKGHDPRRKKQTKAKGEIIKPHETIGYRDHLGRWIPGTSGTFRTKFDKLTELRQALLDACPTDDLQGMLKELHAIAMDRSDRNTQLKAMELYFNRVLGKPTQEMILEKQTVQTKVNVDFTKLTELELKQMETLLSKTEAPEIEVLEYKPGE